MVIPHSRSYIGKREADAVHAIIMSRQLAHGKKARDLELEWASLTRSQDAAMVSSGLSALRLALMALEVGPHDEVVIPALSCVALHNAVLSLGAIPILVDVGADLCLDPNAVYKNTTSSTAAIIAVHLFGTWCDIDSIDERAPVIEDMTHGFFGLGRDVGIASFYPTKNVSGGGGGIVCGDAGLVDIVKDLREYGDKNPSPYRMNDLGNDIHAAIVLEQLKRIEKIEELRAGIGDCYEELLNGDYKFLKTPMRFLVWVEDAAAISEAMKGQGVFAEQPVWDYRHTVDWPDNLPNTDAAFDHWLSLPLYADMTIAEQEQVVEVLDKVMRG